MKNIDWKAYLVIIPVVLLVMDFIIIKAFGQKAFMLAFLKWINKMFHANREIKAILVNQDLANVKRDEFMYSIAASLERVERKVEKVQNEVTFNGGKIKLVDGLKEVLKNQAIYASERNAKLYIDDQPMFKTDGSGRVTFVNAAWLEMVGCTDEEEVMGFGFLIVVPDLDRDTVEKTSERFAKSPAPFHGDFTYKHLKTGDLIKTNVRTQLIRDNNGVFIGTLGTVQILN